MDWYRSCKFFQERITEEGIEDAEVAVGVNRIKDVMGLNRCYTETIPIEGAGGIGGPEK